MSNPSMRDRVASGALLLTLGRLVTRLLDLVTLMILTRILLPGDFGLVAIAMSVVQLTEAVLELSTGQALLQLDKVERSHLDNAFTLALLRGLLVAVLLAALAFPLAGFFGDERLAPLIVALSLAPALRGLRSPRMFSLAQNLQFGRDAFSEVVGKVAALVAAGIIAFATGSYWAIAAGTIVGPLIYSMVTYVVAPHLPRLTLEHWPIFRRFLGWGMAGQVMSALNWQTDRFVLAKLASQATLGLFSTARDLAGTAHKVIFEPVQRPILAALSTARNDLVRLRKAHGMVTGALMSLALPIAIGQALIAGEVVELVLGPKWLEATPVFQIVSLTLIPSLYSNMATTLFHAVGKPEMVFTRNFTDFAFRVPATVACIIAFGWQGALLALVAAELFLAGFCIHSTKRLLGSSISAQLFGPWRAIVSAGIMAVAIVFMRWLIPPGQGTPEIILFLLQVVPVAALTYGATHLLAWQLSGRPAGLEELALKFIFAKWGRFAPFRTLG